MRMNLPISDTVHPVPEGEVLVSKTNLSGAITYCNQTYIEVSGFSREELLGAPHNFVRHPDMPHEVFADLWKTILADKPWRGLIKNRCKDGSYYWLEVHITPLLQNREAVGYVSFGYKATQQQVEQIAAVYRESREGVSKLRIDQGKIVPQENRLQRWMSAASVKSRLLALVVFLLCVLVATGGFNLYEASAAHERSINAVVEVSMQNYALDSARAVELALDDEAHILGNLPLYANDAALHEQYLKKFDKKSEAIQDKLTMLNSTLRNVGTTANPIAEAMNMHLQLVNKFHQAVNDGRESSVMLDRSTQAEVSSLVEQLKIIVAGIKEHQQHDLGELNALLESAHYSERARSVAVLAVAAVLGLSISLWLILGILRPIRRAGGDLGRTVQLQQQFLEMILKLDGHRERMDEEQRVGSFIMSRMTNMQRELEPAIRCYLKPAELLSGDILIAALTPAKVMHILLADAVGHGLSAAINVLPLCQSFYDLTEKGFAIEQIATDLNLLVKKFMPADRFVSATLISIDRQARVIEVWNGGIPAPQLFSHDGRQLHAWGSMHLPLGILPKEGFSGRTELFHYYDEDCQLCLFSDGLSEARSPQNVQFCGEERIAELFGRVTPEFRFDALVAELEAHLQGQPAHDDISLAIVDISAQLDLLPGRLHPDTQEQVEICDDWRVAISLGAHELKYLEVVPLLTQVISKIHVTHEHHSALFLILSELFNNALDHGILQLDSSIKLGADGFDRFLELRTARLQALGRGKIAIEIERVDVGGKQAVTIHVVDSGGGFDYVAMQLAGADQSHRAEHVLQYGRGIALVKSLTCKLDYAGNGNDVTACYICM